MVKKKSSVSGKTKISFCGGLPMQTMTKKLSVSGKTKITFDGEPWRQEIYEPLTKLKSPKKTEKKESKK